MKLFNRPDIGPETYVALLFVLFSLYKENGGSGDVPVGHIVLQTVERTASTQGGGSVGEHSQHVLSSPSVRFAHRLYPKPCAERNCFWDGKSEDTWPRYLTKHATEDGPPLARADAVRGMQFFVKFTKAGLELVQGIINGPHKQFFEDKWAELIDKDALWITKRRRGGDAA